MEKLLLDAEENIKVAEKHCGEEWTIPYCLAAIAEQLQVLARIALEKSTKEDVNGTEDTDL